MLLLFGLISIFSVGLPFLVGGSIAVVAGLTGVHRSHPSGFWAVVVAIGAFFVGYVLLAPLSCTSRAATTEDGQVVGGTTCTNLVGIDYSGGRDYQPSLRPALAVGAVAGVLAGISVRSLLARRSG